MGAVICKNCGGPHAVWDCRKKPGARGRQAVAVGATSPAAPGASLPKSTKRLINRLETFGSQPRRSTLIEKKKATK